MARRGAVTSRFKRHDAKAFTSSFASDYIVSFVYELCIPCIKNPIEHYLTLQLIAEIYQHMTKIMLYM